MLGVFSDNVLNGVNESLELAQALAKEGLESFPADRDINLVLYLTLVFLPSKQGGILQEGSRKQNLIWACGTSSGKVIFTLLEEIITPQVSFTSINVWELSFQRPLRWAFIVQSGGINGGRKKCKRFRI